jgi:hypothetical protein
MDWLFGVLALAVMAGLAWVGFRLEPHWVSKDGRRFMCSGQIMSRLGQPNGRWRETRVIIDQRGEVQVDQKRMMRRRSSRWTVQAESPDPPKRRAVFLLSSHDNDGHADMLALRLPANSRAIPVLRESMKP